MIEEEAIPYEPALLRGERLLVLAPHPDDEVIGCGGLVALHLREKRPVRVVVATDGSQAGEALAREEESRRALARLGGAELVFLGYPDRALGDDASTRLREELLAFRPDLVLVPSPIEIHPDHLALSRLFVELVQRDELLFADLAVARVAFYEVGQPLRPNAIVDISEVAEAKYAAIGEHASQLALRDYVAFVRGLNAFRAMTLPPGTAYAEAYFVVDLPSLRTTSFSELRVRTGTPPAIEVTAEAIPISVIIRTKDRPALLREAIDSVHATGYPAEIVVVNDGGARPDVEGVTLIHHETSLGRAEAGNAGVRAASKTFIVFLDDDDLFYPEHLRTLANAAATSHAAWYTDAVSAFLRPGENGAYEIDARMRIYAQDFDRDLLYIDNYIPLPALLMRRQSFLDAGGFDAQFDLFEDWDLLIRLAARGDFLRIPRVTCEVRHFQGGSSIVLATPEGSERFREAKLRIWKKHAQHLGHDVFANVFERQKRRLGDQFAQLVEARGQADNAQRDIARLSREKDQVMAQNLDASNMINGYALRQRELEGAVQSLTHVADQLAPQLELRGREVERLAREIERLTHENDELRASNLATHQELERTRVEIQRLGGLLDMIYRSRTWKLHTMLEKARGRG